MRSLPLQIGFKEMGGVFGPARERSGSLSGGNLITASIVSSHRPSRKSPADSSIPHP